MKKTLEKHKLIFLLYAVSLPALMLVNLKLWVYIVSILVYVVISNIYLNKYKSEITLEDFKKITRNMYFSSTGDINSFVNHLIGINSLLAISTLLLTNILSLTLLFVFHIVFTICFENYLMTLKLSNSKNMETNTLIIKEFFQGILDKSNNWYFYGKLNSNELFNTLKTDTLKQILENNEQTIKLKVLSQEILLISTGTTISREDLSNMKNQAQDKLELVLDSMFLQENEIYSNVKDLSVKNKGVLLKNLKVEGIVHND